MGLNPLVRVQPAETDDPDVPACAALPDPAKGLR